MKVINKKIMLLMVAVTCAGTYLLFKSNWKLSSSRKYPQDNGNNPTLKYQDNGNNPIRNHEDNGNNPIRNHQDNGNNPTHNHQDNGHNPIHNGNNPYVKTYTKLSPFLNKVELTPAMPRPVNCPRMITKPNFTVCLHEPLEHWSRSLLRDKFYEKGTTSAINKMLTTYPSASFIDIGSNVGYFAHLAAARGRKVIPIDPLVQNVRPLLWAARIDGMESQVTMLQNAVSDKNTEMVVSTPLNNRWDMTFIGQMSDVKNKSWINDRKKSLFPDIVTSKTVKTITLNDLVDVVTTPEAIMKIDVEGHECGVFHEPSSSRFFSKVFVPYFIMEWRFTLHATRIPSACTADGVVTLVNYLWSIGYRPSVYNSGSNKLEAADTSQDIYANVIWMQERAKNFLPSKEI